MASPTLIAFSAVKGQLLANATESTATLTWQTGDILVAVAGNEGVVSGMTIAAPTNTGSGIAWTTQQSYTNGSDCCVGGWTAVATANSSGTVTTKNPSGSTNNNTFLGVYQFRAPSGSTIAVGTSGLGTGLTTSPQLKAITMTSVDSSVVWAAGDWSAATAETNADKIGAGSTTTGVATSHGTSAPGPTASPVDGPAVGTNYTPYIDEIDDQTSTGSISYGYSGSSTGPFSIVVIEITISGGAAAAPPFFPHRMPLSA